LKLIAQISLFVFSLIVRLYEQLESVLPLFCCVLCLGRNAENLEALFYFTQTTRNEKYADLSKADELYSILNIL